MYNIVSSHGSLTANHLGVITAVEDFCCDDLKQYMGKAIDLAEFVAFWGYAERDLDILDTSFMNEDGTVMCEPEYAYRLVCIEDHEYQIQWLNSIKGIHADRQVPVELKSNDDILTTGKWDYCELADRIKDDPSACPEWLISWVFDVE